MLMLIYNIVYDILMIHSYNIHSLIITFWLVIGILIKRSKTMKLANIKFTILTLKYREQH